MTWLKQRGGGAGSVEKAKRQFQLKLGGRMICDACLREWVLLRAHLKQYTDTPEGKRELVQCPSCGHLQVVLSPSGAENGD